MILEQANRERIIDRSCGSKFRYSQEDQSIQFSVISFNKQLTIIKIVTTQSYSQRSELNKNVIVDRQKMFSKNSEQITQFNLTNHVCLIRPTSVMKNLQVTICH